MAKPREYDPMCPRCRAEAGKDAAGTTDTTICDDHCRAELAETRRERDELRAKLDTNRCNRGHETLPLVLWDCPECHAETKRRLDEAVALLQERPNAARRGSWSADVDAFLASLKEQP